MKNPTGTSETNSAPPKKRVGPFTFIGQVRTEARKVTWTSYRETWVASVMVVIMVVLAAIFFYATDSIVKLLVGFLTGIWTGELRPMAEPRWYIVHAYSNFEKKVASTIREQADMQGLGDLIVEIEVPTEEVVEVVRGRKRTVEKRHMPGYVLVKMLMTDEAYHLIKNTPKVTGFLGAEGGKKPLPVPQKEVDQILGKIEAGAAAPRVPRCSSRSARRSKSPTVRSLRSKARWTRSTKTRAA